MNLQKFVPILRRAIIIGVFALLLTPFIVSNNLYFPYITGKAFYFRIVTEIIFGLWIVLALVESKYRPKKSPVMISFVVFVIVMFIANWLGSNRVSSFGSNFERMEGFVTIIHLLMLSVSVSTVFSKSNWTWLLNTSIGMSLISVVQAFSQISEKGFNYRVDTTLGNSTYLAAYMLFSAFISVLLLTQIQAGSLKNLVKNFRTWIYVVAFLLQSVILFQTGTRGAMIGLLGGLFLAAVLIVIFAKGQSALRKTFGGVILVVLIFVGSLFVFKDSNWVKGTQSLNRITTISASEGTAQARLWNWGIAWQGVKENPILGWGQSNYNLVYDKHFDPQMYEQEPWFDRTHNIIFDWLIAGGFLGLISYLAVLISALYVLWRKTDLQITEKSVLTGLLAGYFVHNLFVFDNIVSYLFFVIILSLIVSRSEAKEICDTRVAPDTQRIVAGVILVATCCTIYFVNHNSYVAARDVISAIQMFKKEEGKLMYNNENGLDENLRIFKDIIDRDTYGNPEIRARLISSAGELNNIQGLPVEIKDRFTDYAIEQMLKQIEEAPTDSRYPYILSSVYLQTGDIGKSVEMINRAIELAPKKQTFHFFLAQIYLNSGEKQKAIESARFAYDLAPQLDTAWMNYTSILSVADRVEFEKYIKSQIEMGETQRVEKMLLQQITRKADSYQGYVSLGAFYFQTGQIEKSKNILNEAVLKFPQVKVQLEQLLKQIESGKNPLGKGF